MLRNLARKNWGFITFKILTHPNWHKLGEDKKSNQLAFSYQTPAA
jgi:hypothetical protein